MFKDSPLSPLLLAWIITVILRVALGSATVAALTAAGLVQPMLASASPNTAALMVLAIGAGSIAASHVNDAGFWMFKDSPLSPLLLAWIITVILRVALGSATVAALTAAGLVQPMLASASPNTAALMVLAIGAGSIAASHVNDAGFWMFKEYFDLDVKQTLKTWTVLETIIAVVGLGIVMLMSIWVH